MRTFASFLAQGFSYPIMRPSIACWTDHVLLVPVSVQNCTDWPIVLSWSPSKAKSPETGFLKWRRFCQGCEARPAVLSEIDGTAAVPSASDSCWSQRPRLYAPVEDLGALALGHRGRLRLGRNFLEIYELLRGGCVHKGTKIDNEV
eukprot:CAMPEP_0182504290 /NCGR_PEP_ID=MMETSP1321-20130603/16949_1 /TAXON_ID=91990 /ORGANISM="Bolidomonas sp., Strain RCC1657" /LENGTH=145 /DNA_ID=CAMNT_0024709613 /DNA_START=486 /DNA_END=923 /DNA_ORIENTATION=-